MFLGGFMDKYVAGYYDCWFAVNEFYEQWAKSRGLTVNSLFVLYTVNALESPDQSEICRRLFLPKQTVNSILNLFEKSGYLLRRRKEADARNKEIVITEKGKEYAGKILSELYGLEEAAISSMDIEEKEGLIKYNRLFLERLQKFNGERK